MSAMTRSLDMSNDEDPSSLSRTRTIDNNASALRRTTEADDRPPSRAENRADGAPAPRVAERDTIATPPSRTSSLGTASPPKRADNVAVIPLATSSDEDDDAEPPSRFSPENDSAMPASRMAAGENSKSNAPSSFESTNRDHVAPSTKPDSKEHGLPPSASHTKDQTTSSPQTAPGRHEPSTMSKDSKPNETSSKAPVPAGATSPSKTNPNKNGSSTKESKKKERLDPVKDYRDKGFSVQEDLPLSVRQFARSGVSVAPRDQPWKPSGYYHPLVEESKASKASTDKNASSHPPAADDKNKANESDKAANKKPEQKSTGVWRPSATPAHPPVAYFDPPSLRWSPAQIRDSMKTNQPQRKPSPTGKKRS